ncbi:hypothetical protein [Haloarchaeobius sp. TZWWS8]|uniref:hypothetical protein n=1 Tax=Haloarchaeobius sp. TZWWS8 TaxID=3446121 RepID=UPI003EBCE897
MSLQFIQTSDPTGLQVVDPLAKTSLQLRLSSNEFRPGPEDVPFSEYVEETVVVETDHIYLDYQLLLHVRNEEMAYLEELRKGDRRSFESGTYVIDFSTPQKCYLFVEGRPKIEQTSTQTRILFERERQVTLGFRSTENVPTETVVTTERPSDIARAISALGDSHLSSSPERSWPTLRTYPPRIEIGDRLHIPDTIESPSSGIELVVPPRYAALLCAAPLAYYLGADLRIGEAARVETSATTVDIGVTRTLEDDLVRLLKQVFVLDCACRTEGLYRSTHYLDDQLFEALPFDTEWAFEADIASRLEEYLDVPYNRIEKSVPRWSAVAYLPPAASSVPALSHVLHRLGIVRPARGTLVSKPSISINQFTRFGGGTFVGPERFVEPTVFDDAVSHIWFGPGTPLTGEHGSLQAYENRLRSRTPTESVDITVVCNEETMVPEQRSLDRFYRNSFGIDREVHLRTDVNQEELSRLLSDEQCDLFHFIGHASKEGLRCSDGQFDVNSLDSLCPDLFVLNACDTYHQAKDIVEHGGVAVVATHARVSNEEAVRAGQDVARLLADGFSVCAATEQVGRSLSGGSPYIVVGDGLARIASQMRGNPSVMTLTQTGDDEYRLDLDVYLQGVDSVGGWTSFTLRDQKQSRLDAGRISFTDVHATLLVEELPAVSYPLFYRDSLHWLESEADVRELLEGHSSSDHDRSSS